MSNIEHKIKKVEKQHKKEEKQKQETSDLYKKFSFKSLFLELGFSSSVLLLLERLYKKYMIFFVGIIAVIILTALYFISSNVMNMFHESKIDKITTIYNSNNLENLKAENPYLYNFINQKDENIEAYNNILTKLDKKEEVLNYISSNNSILKELVSLQASFYYLKQKDTISSNEFLAFVKSPSLEYYKTEIFKNISILNNIKKDNEK